MKKWMLLAVVSLFSATLMGQDSKIEVFGGYQFLHTGNVTVNGASQPGSSQNYNGWNAAAQYNLSKNLGVEGDFSGGYGSNSGVSTHFYTYSGGPVVFTHAGKLKPFAHVLFGGARLSASSSGVSISTNGYTVMVGGGVDANLSKLLAFRVAQFDWLYYHFSGFTAAGQTTPAFSGSGNVRISTGIVFHF